MTVIRPSAVAGMFYPAEPAALDKAVSTLLSAALRGRQSGTSAPPPKAIIAPHAGYVFSGSTAAQAYAELAPIREQVRRVVLLGPTHRVAVNGLATTSADYWRTPLGAVRIDPIVKDLPERFPQLSINDLAHAREHSLEVHLPFLIKLLPDFVLLPFAVGRASTHDVSALLDALWGGPETLILISSDLSHFLSYDAARKLDTETAAAIEALDASRIGNDQACGRVPLYGLIASARTHGLAVDRLALCNSGDTAGEKDRVVGYGSWALRPVA